jgi:hypothetical protein
MSAVWYNREDDIIFDDTEKNTFSKASGGRGSQEEGMGVMH